MTTTKSATRKTVEKMGGYCGVIPAWEAGPEQWQTVKDPARWIGVGGKRLDADECREMVRLGELVEHRYDKVCGVTIYKLAVQS